jgi:NADPH:quinone reductase-like Zn-dependent oxidoreductase
MPADLVPLSDSAGEIIAIGEDVQGWKVGDRVSANFAPGHIHGATSPEIQATSLGGQAHGVLTEYRTFPANVGFISCLFAYYIHTDL